MPMTSTLDRQFDATMRPLTRQAQSIMVQFGRWLVAELHERGAQTRGFGYIDPKWLLYRHDYAKEDLRCWLTSERLFYLLARVFFYGRPRDVADCALCEQTATLAQMYGLIGGQPCQS